MAGAAVLKDGNSATVVRLRLGDRGYVVKRYNHKNAWQALRRNLRPTARFRRAWCNGQRLHMLHIPTARPLLLLERRFGPLRGVAYLVMEDLGDLDLATAAAGDTDLDGAVVQGTTTLLRALSAAGLVHGDTKASNFLLTDRGVAIIDLDALREGEAGRAGDLQRFLANFDGRPALQRRFEQALVEAGLV